MKWLSKCLSMVLCILFAATADISVSGIVKKKDGVTGIPGVKVSLLKQSDLSAITDDDGKFSISKTKVLQHSQKSAHYHLTMNGRTVYFPNNLSINSGDISIFSITGKRVFSKEIDNTPFVVLPELGSGIYFIHINLDGNQQTYSLTNIAKNRFLKKQRSISRQNSSDVSLSIIALPIDTLIAEKSGYITRKIPLESYTQRNITIILDSADGSQSRCTREFLNAVGESYVEALKNGDPKKMELAEDAKYMENMSNSSLDDGIWKSKVSVDFHRCIVDVDSCLIFVEAIDTSKVHQYVIGARITVKEGKVSIIDALVTDEGDWLFNAVNYLKYSSREAWTLIPKEKQDDRETIRKAGDAYLDLFNDTTVIVPWGKPCQRLEGGVYTGRGVDTDSCNVGVPYGVSIVNRKYVIDVDLGTVQIFCRFGGPRGLPDSHMFRVENGKLRFVHTLTWCPDTGCM